MERGTERAGFADCDEDVERGVESGDASTVEASAVELRASTEQRIPGPFRIVRAVDWPLETDPSVRRSHPPSPD